MDAREANLIAEQVFDAKKYRIRTHVIALVVDYDDATNTVTVQPVTRAIRLTDPDNVTTFDLPQISEVPVLQRGSGKVWLTVAPAVDTYGLCHISDRIIDDWLAAGGIVDPTGIRCHDLSDAIFEPSLLHLVDEEDNGKFTAAIETDRISMRTRTGKTEVSVLDDETIEINVNDGKASITIDTSGNVSVESQGDVSIAADGDVVMEQNAGESMTVGSSSVDAGNGSDFVALATKVQANFDLINTIIGTTWVPVANDGGAALKTTWGTAWSAGVQQVASGNLKAD